MRRDIVRTKNPVAFAAFGKHGIKEDIAAFENILIKLFYVFVTNAFVFEYFTKEINDSTGRRSTNELRRIPLTPDEGDRADP